MCATFFPSSPHAWRSCVPRRSCQRIFVGRDHVAWTLAQLFTFSGHHEFKSGDRCHKCAADSSNRESHSRSKQRPSSEGAKERSPRRKPWVVCRSVGNSPGGAKET